MTINYCLPVIRQRKQDVFDEIARAQGDYAYFEVWLDYVKEADEAFVRGLCEQHPGKVLFLFRRQQLEPIHMPLATRLSLLHSLSQLPALVDLDASQREELDYLRENNLQPQLVASYHNYHATPPDAALQQISTELLSYRPAVVKLSTYCNAEEDALRLLALQLQLKQQGHRHVVLGMGVHGAVTRIFGTVWGNELVFAPQTDDEASASGQLTRAQLENIFHALVAS